MDAVEATINFTLDDVVDIYKMLDPDEKVFQIKTCAKQTTGAHVEVCFTGGFGLFVVRTADDCPAVHNANPAARQR